jgi:hypothetical protein
MVLATVEDASKRPYVDTCACYGKHNSEMSETGGCASRWEDRQGSQILDLIFRRGKTAGEAWWRWRCQEVNFLVCPVPKRALM